MLQLNFDKIVIRSIKLTILIGLFQLSQPLFAQLTTKQIFQIDSLRRLIKKTSSDTIRIKSMRAWDNLIYNSNPALDLSLNKQIDSICTKKLSLKLSKIEKHFYYFEKAYSLNVLGIVEYDKGNYNEALRYYSNSLKMLTLLKNKSGIAAGLNNIGSCYQRQGNITKAVEYFRKSLKIQESLKNKIGIASSLGNIGLLYKEQGDLANALAYSNKSLLLLKSINDQQRIELTYNIIGHIYLLLTDDIKQGIESDTVKKLLKLSLYNLNQGKLIAEKIGDEQDLANILTNIGSNYLAQKKLDSALSYYNKGLAIYQKFNDQFGLCNAYNNLGEAYLQLGLLDKSEKLLLDGLRLSQENKLVLNIRDAAESLFMVHEKKGNSDKALEMYELYVSYSDSIASDETKKEIVRHEFKYQYEKKATADSIVNAKQREIKNAEIAEQKAEIKAKRIQQFMLFGGLALILIFAGFMFNRVKITLRQKKEIETQKEMVEEKQKEIMDSIRYARRIQRALLPSAKYIDKSLKKYFR